MPGGRATTRHADSALRSTKRAACAAAVGPERRDDERLRHERKLVDGRDPIGFRRASVIGVIGEWAFDHRRIGRSTAGLGRHLPQHTKSGWYSPWVAFCAGPLFLRGGFLRGGAMNQSAWALVRQFSGLQRPCHKTRSGQAGKEFLRCACAYVAHNVCELTCPGRSRLVDVLLAPRAPARPTNVRNAGPARCHSRARARENKLSGVLLETRSSTLSEPARAQCARAPLCDLV